MSDGSKIEWLARPGTKPATWNPIKAESDIPGKVGTHCERASEGCRNCYAEAGYNQRFGTGLPYTRHRRDVTTTYIDENTLTKPLHWRSSRTIFVCSTSDIFGDWVPDDIIDRVFAVAALCPQHTFIFLTKRMQRMREYCSARNGMGNAEIYHAINEIPANLGNRHGALSMHIPNVWLGVTTENQKTADERIPHLLATPAAIRFVPCEPMLGAIDLQSIRDPNTFPGCLRKDVLQGREYHEDDGDQWTKARNLNWVICGGESGPNARPMHPDWVRGLRNQSVSAGVPFFFKSCGSCFPCDWGGEDDAGNSAYVLDEEHTRTDIIDYDKLGRGQYIEAHNREYVRFPHKRTGDLLDGVQHHAWPEVRS